MSWNYRVVEFADPVTGESWYAIHEVYYNEHGEPKSYADEPAVIASKGLNWADSIRLALKNMGTSVTKPTLREIDFSEGSGRQEVDNGTAFVLEPEAPDEH